MAAPSQINTLRAEDFPDGIGTKSTADKLFQLLNPFLQNVQQTTTAGTALQSNIDGQFAQADIPVGSGWRPMTLTSPFAGNSLTPWPQPSYRVDGTGRVWLRGLMTAASAPTANQAIWVYPNPLMAPTNSTPSAAGRLFAAPVVIDGFVDAAMCRIDAQGDHLAWGSVAFAGMGVGSWVTLPLATNWVNASGPTPSYMIGGDRRVYIRGNIGISAANFTTGGTVATLPVGARPAVQMDFPGTFDGATNPLIAAFIRIGTDGTIKVFSNGGPQHVNSLPLGHLSFDLDLTFNPGAINYLSLDQISWDTKGGPSLATRPCFPLNIRLKDGKKPVAVLCWAVNKNTNAVEICTEPGWTPLGTGTTGNQLRIDNVANLRDDQPYTLNFFVFF